MKTAAVVKRGRVAGSKMAGINADTAMSLRQLLGWKLEKSGWRNVRHFWESSGISREVSSETVRKVFNTDHGPVPVVILILHYLQFDANEIRDILTQYTQDRVYHQLIGEGADALNERQQALLRVFGSVDTLHPDFFQHVLGLVKPLAPEEMADDVRLLLREDLQGK